MYISIYHCIISLHVNFHIHPDGDTDQVRDSGYVMTVTAIRMLVTLVLQQCQAHVYTKCGNVHVHVYANRGFTQSRECVCICSAVY
jgi:hypothetical protein